MKAEQRRLDQVGRHVERGPERRHIEALDVVAALRPGPQLLKHGFCMWLDVPWLLPLYGLLSAQLFCGLVERRIRRELLRGGSRPVPSSESPRPHDWVWLASIGIVSSLLLIVVAVA